MKQVLALVGLLVIGWVAFSYLSKLPISDTDLIQGNPRIIDGDSLVINGNRIRLSGIDAPEPNQQCEDKISLEIWNCGQVSTQSLIDLIGSEEVRCVGKDRDRYQRVLAVCYLRDINLNEWLVLNGLAIAYTRYSKEYVPAEAVARQNEVGIWGSNFQTPEEWRHSKNNQ